jgi:protein phosphatase 1 regulatory subunit 37
MIKDYPDSASMTLSSSNSSSNLQHTASSDSAYHPHTSRPRRPDQQTDDANLPTIPMVGTGSSILTRILPEGYKQAGRALPGLVVAETSTSAGSVISSTAVEGKLSAVEIGGASVALQRSVRALDGVERIGRLLTLDLKGNEIRNGVTYIAQVLKRNRTLKVLNLSDNKIDVSGLSAIAEALVS